MATFALSLEDTAPLPALHMRLQRAPAVSLGRRLRVARLRQLGLRMAVLLASSLSVAGLYGAQAHSEGPRPTADAAPAANTAPMVEPMPFEKAGDSFPGSAYYYLSGNDSAPLLPATGDQAAHATAGPPAHPLVAALAPLDYSRALTCLTSAIYYEAATEPDDGQRAVAQVVLNRLAHPAFPKTVCDVVYQGSERNTGCQFTFSCDGALARAPNRLFWERAQAVAKAALAGFVYAPVGLATHYHTFAVHPAWADSLAFIGQIGAHRFYRFAGPAGATAAFRTAYAGGEPLPGPHPRLLSAQFTAMARAGA
ncbi:MAG TPA: cell wall hydrolase, partial [Novosphingobium sp.]|nr:cell wall hydrolase [Novosphingobium sp.]